MSLPTTISRPARLLGLLSKHASLLSGLGDTRHKYNVSGPLFAVDRIEVEVKQRNDREHEVISSRFCHTCFNVDPQGACHIVRLRSCPVYCGRCIGSFRLSSIVAPQLQAQLICPWTASGIQDIRSKVQFDVQPNGPSPASAFHKGTGSESTRRKSMGPDP